MKCPHCLVSAVFDVNHEEIYSCGFHNESKGYSIHHTVCPSCCKPIVELVIGKALIRNTGHSAFEGRDFEVDSILYPLTTIRSVAPEVPESYCKDYIEASSILLLSPKASAALCRRVLQNILREEFNIKKRTLSEEISTFIGSEGTPSHLADAVDAVRNIGNYAAHPSKDKNTGEIVEVEQGEAEWLLEVLEVLFDFTFVQPKRLEKRKNELNEKLKSIGKPPMKGK